MKHLTLLFGLISILSSLTFGQAENDFFFDEFNVSVNRTAIQNNNNKENRFGFGFGAYHSFMTDKKLNLVFGLEFNRTSQFIKQMYEGHYAKLTNLTYHLNFFSIPLGLRLTAGNKTKVFIETGGYADLMLNSNRTGTLQTWLPNENHQIIYTLIEIDQKVKLSDSIGLYFGLGVRIPLSRFEIIIKPDYKFGINKLYSYQDDIYSRYFRINIGIKTIKKNQRTSLNLK